MNNLYAQGSNDKRETATLPIPSESCVGWLCFFTFLQPVMSHFHKRGEVQHLACTEQNPVSRNIKWNHTNEVSETQSEQNPQQALAQTGVLQRAVITRLPSHLRSWGKSLLVKALHHDSGDPNLIIFFFFFLLHTSSCDRVYGTWFFFNILLLLVPRWRNRTNFTRLNVQFPEAEGIDE